MPSFIYLVCTRDISDRSYILSGFYQIYLASKSTGSRKVNWTVDMYNFKTHDGSQVCKLYNVTQKHGNKAGNMIISE